MNRFLKNKSGAVDKRILIIAAIVIIAVFFFSQLKQVVKCTHGKTESSLEFVLFKSDKKHEIENCETTTTSPDTGSTPGEGGGGKVGDGESGGGSGSGDGGGDGTPDEGSDIEIPDEYIPVSYYEKADATLVCKNSNSYYALKIPKEAGPQASGTRTLTISNKQGWDIWMRISKVDTANGLNTTIKPSLYAHIPNGESLSFPVTWHWDVPFGYTGKRGEAVLYFESICSKPKESELIMPIPTANDFKVTKKDDNSVTLQWKQSEHAVKYRLERYTSSPWKLDYSTEMDSFGYIDNTVKPQTGYQYRLIVYNSKGESSTAKIDIATDASPLRPTTPQNFKVTNSTASEASLSWNAVQNAASYTVKIDGKEVWTGAGTSYKALGLNQNQDYKFSVRANNSFGYSSDANTTVKTKIKEGLPSVPLNFRIIDTTQTTMTLQWDKPANASSFLLKQFNTTIWEGANNTYKVTGLVPGTSYTFYLHSKNNIGLSLTNTYVAGKTNGASPPWAPSNFIFENVTNYEITLRWNAVSNADYYIVKDSNNNILYEGTQTSYRVTDLRQNTNYTFYVRGVGKTGASGWSSKSGITTNYMHDDSENISDTCKPEIFSQTFVLPKDIKSGTAGIFEFKINNTMNAKLKTKVKKVTTYGSLFEGTYPIKIEYNDSINQVAPKTNFTYSFKWIFPSQGKVDANPNASNSIYVEIESECI